MLKIDLDASKALRGLRSHLCFFRTLLYESSWRKRTETQDKAGHLWVPADCELSSSHLASESGADVIHKPPLKKQKRKVLGQRAVWSKGHGNHTEQDETRVMTCFFALSFLWHFYS